MEELPSISLIIFTGVAMMASAQVVEASVNTNSSPSQDYTTNPDDHSNHNIDSPGFKPFTVIYLYLNSRSSSQKGT